MTLEELQERLNKKRCFYTKEETNQMLNEVSLKVMVEQLPDNGTENYLYLVPSTVNPGTYEQYIWEDNNWQHLGNVEEAKLTDFVTEPELRIELDKQKTYVEVTWLELKNLRDTNKLIPGAHYRITDYITTTTQTDTNSAGHQFDVIVLALSENKLAEEGLAIRNENNLFDVTFADSVTKKCWIYFEGSHYNIVEDKTQLGNNSLTSGNVTIDFSAKTAQCPTLNSTSLTTPNLSYNNDYFKNSNLSAWKIWYSLDNNRVKYGWADTTNGKGVIYRMIDEWNNDCPYDFKNIQFVRPLNNNYEYDENGTDTYVYTFNAFLNGTKMDNSLGMNLSLFGGSGISTTCAGNIIKPFYETENQQSVIVGNGLIFLNNNVFIAVASTLNDLLNLFISYNKFEDNSKNNTFGSFIHSNTFGPYCRDNSFTNNCVFNNIDSYFYNNNISRNFQFNNIGGNFYNNNIDANFQYNNVGDYVHDNYFNYSCIYNKFGNNISNCSFSQIEQVNNEDPYFHDNIVGNACAYLIITGSTYGCTFGNNLYSINMIDMQNANIIIENGVKYVTLECPANDSYDKVCQNITIAQGTSGTQSSPKQIIHPTVNDTFQTIYKPQNSQITLV